MKNIFKTMIATVAIAICMFGFATTANAAEITEDVIVSDEIVIVEGEDIIVSTDDETTTEEFVEIEVGTDDENESEDYVDGEDEEVLGAIIVEGDSFTPDAPEVTDGVIVEEEIVETPVEDEVVEKEEEIPTPEIAEEEDTWEPKDPEVSVPVIDDEEDETPEIPEIPEVPEVTPDEIPDETPDNTPDVLGTRVPSTGFESNFMVIVAMLVIGMALIVSDKKKVAC